MGVKETIFKFDPDGNLLSAETIDTRDLEEERERLLGELARAADRLLGATDWYALRALDALAKPMPDAVKAERNTIRDAIDAEQAAVKGAKSLEVLDAIQWGSTVYGLSLLPETAAELNKTKQSGKFGEGA